jgi:hypothetical protein
MFHGWGGRRGGPFRGGGGTFGTYSCTWKHMFFIRKHIDILVCTYVSIHILYMLYTWTFPRGGWDLWYLFIYMYKYLHICISIYLFVFVGIPYVHIYHIHTICSHISYTYIYMYLYSYSFICIFIIYRTVPRGGWDL